MQTLKRLFNWQRLFFAGGHLLWLSVLLLMALSSPLSFLAEASEDRTGGGLLAPLPAEVPTSKDNPVTSEKVALGKQLFFDPRLSGDNTMSCASCHAPEKAFTDGVAKAQGKDDKTLDRNTPALLNAGFLSSFFWDGRAGSLEEQAFVPIQSPDEMNQGLAELEKELNAIPAYREQFQTAFGTDVTRDGIAKALAAFQRTLVTGPSPFDRYLMGEEDALSEEAREGMRLFAGEAGCVRCHHGPLLSDGRFYRLGVGYGDKGRGVVTGREEDNYTFRTPSLRNVAQTAPYMHDGSRGTLDDAVTFYYRGVRRTGPDGLPLDIQSLEGRSFSEISAIVALLESLTGEPPEVSAPELP